LEAGRLENIPSHSVPAPGVNLARQGYVSDNDSRERFFVPGIQRAGGLGAAMRLVNSLRAAIPGGVSAGGAGQSKWSSLDAGATEATE
jgi:hypothetical protein